MNLPLNKIACINFFLLLLLSCTKLGVTTNSNAQLTFTSNDITFDTVFTDIGSTTKNIRIKNLNKENLKISSIRLEKGNASQFKINVDGNNSLIINNIEILAEDSLYLFIQVKIDPTSQLSPLIVEDKIIFEVNGKIQVVTLLAYGQSAHYHKPTFAKTYSNGLQFKYSKIAPNNNTTVKWGGGTGLEDNKPHVIFDWLIIDSTQKLIINPTVKVYFHQNAGMWVYRYGTLQVNGTYGNEVVFQGDRLEESYKNVPGQWNRIWINEGSTDNYINYAVIKNAFIGLQAEVIYTNTPAPKKLKLTNTVIKNASLWGLYASSYNIWAANNVITNCKGYCVLLNKGGNYTMIHNTIANYFNASGGRADETSLYIGNVTDNLIYPYDSIYFANTIVDGTKTDEVTMNITKYQSSNPNQTIQFNHCLLKSTVNTTSVALISNTLYNLNLGFVDPINNNYQLNTNSDAKKKASSLILATYPSILNVDINNQVRGASPSSGAIE